MNHATYMKISGIPGDCAQPAHKDWIEVLNCSNSVVAPDHHGRPAQHMDMAINKYLDRSSPLLALACSEGWRLEEILIETCAEDGTRVMELRLSDAAITNYNLSSGGDPNHAAYDSLCLKFGKMEWRYFPAGSDRPVACTWTSEEFRAPGENARGRR